MRHLVYGLLSALLNRGASDIARTLRIYAAAARGVLWLIDAKRLDAEVAAVAQSEELGELGVLASTLRTKAVALRSGGFAEEHGSILEDAANRLAEAHGWDHDAVMAWFGDLVLDGEGVSVPGFELVAADGDEWDDEEGEDEWAID